MTKYSSVEKAYVPESRVSGLTVLDELTGQTRASQLPVYIHSLFIDNMQRSQSVRPPERYATERKKKGIMLHTEGSLNGNYRYLLNDI
jgi:hypothetical protein